LESVVNIKACIEGERKAQQNMFNHYASYVYTICRRYSRNDEDAKEAMQDCFLRVFNKLDNYDPTKGELKPWIARVSVNVCLNKIRPRVKNISEHMLELKEQHMTVPFVEVDYTNDTQEEILLRSIQKLTTGYRQVLNLYVFERMKHKEIAEKLNISAATSRSQFARAKAQLKKIVEENKITQYGT